MPKPFTCWVIVAGDNPTAFRARNAEDLLPTLKQLQRTQPDVRLKWFERNKLWDSPDSASEALVAERQRERRGRSWRPGGSHEDPRARFEISRDERRARFKGRLIAKKTRGGENQKRGPRRGPSR